MQNSVLLVDDDVGIRTMLTLFLQHKGYAVVGTSNGQEALEHLQQIPVYPGLILLDMMMPVMSGPEFRQAQRQDAALGTIPVAILSAAGDAQQTASALEVAAYIPKPVDLEALLGVVSTYCGPPSA